MNKETGESFVKTQHIDIKAGKYRMRTLEPCKQCGTGLRMLKDIELKGCPKCTREALEKADKIMTDKVMIESEPRPSESAVGYVDGDEVKSLMKELKGA